MNKRTALTAGDLFVLLDREFRRRKPSACAGCFVQLPFRVDQRDPRDVNWETVIPAHCKKGCDATLAELVDEFQSLYDLQVPGAER